MTTLAQAVWMFGNVAERQPQQVADALRIPLVIVEEVVANTVAGLAWGQRDITAFQVTATDAGGIDPAVVAFVAEHLEKWRANFRIEIADKHRGSRNEIHSLQDKITEIIEALRILEGRVGAGFPPTSCEDGT